jgi:phosphonoacetaldehyde hydrolase
MKNLIPIARDKGYVPDYCCTVSDVPRGRPYPDMCLDNALVLMASDVRGCVVVDDSPSGLEAGLAAGMWTVAIAASGNEIGLDLASWRALGAQERATLLAQARQRLARTGTHYVIDTIADLMPVITQIEARMAQGEQP